MLDSEALQRAFMHFYDFWRHSSALQRVLEGVSRSFGGFSAIFSYGGPKECFRKVSEDLKCVTVSLRGFSEAFQGI